MTQNQAAASSNASFHVELGQACLDVANPVCFAVCSCISAQLLGNKSSTEACRTYCSDGDG